MTVLAEIGRCIYCGSADPPLSIEHIIPFGIGGDDVLVSASCTRCQRAINEGYESRLLRSSLLPFRTLLGLPTRNVADRPTHFTVELERGGVWFEEEIPVGAYPAIVSWPVFYPPGSANERPETELRFRRLRNIVLNHPTRGQPNPELEELGATRIRFGFRIRPFDLARELAKIAYGYAVTAYGLKAFQPFVIPTILNASNDASKWIGCDELVIPIADLRAPHTVQVGLAGESIVTARIQLFSEPAMLDGVPEYVVRVGQLR
jgi:hypothetical protein